MQIEWVKRGGMRYPSDLSQALLDGVAFDSGEISASVSPPRRPPPPVSSSLGVGSIEHHVSKMDTLAGIAIKYGVEVADIKRMNGLVTDLQMFAHKKLQIPLPGRHPASQLTDASSCNGEQSPLPRRNSSVLQSFHQSLKLKPPRQKASPALINLRGYFNLTSPKKSSEAEGTELAVYRGSKLNLDCVSSPQSLSVLELPPGRYQETETIISSFPVENDKFTGDIVMKGNSGGTFSGRTGKGLALRLKGGHRADSDAAQKNLSAIGDSFTSDGFITVRKSSSATDLQDSDGCLWLAKKWTLSSDPSSTPLFDGLSKPVASRRSKAALD